MNTPDDQIERPPTSVADWVFIASVMPGVAMVPVIKAIVLGSDRFVRCLRELGSK